MSRNRSARADSQAREGQVTAAYVPAYVPDDGPDDGPLDARSRRTRIQIRDAFMDLLMEQDFDRITVRALVQRAGINRATFYRHYHDIHDLAHRLTDVLFLDVVEQVASSPPAPDAAQDDWEVLFLHVEQYAAFYRAMLQPGGIPGFRARVEAVVAAQMQELLPHVGLDSTSAHMPVELAVRYMAAAQVGFMQWWLENDMPFPPKQAAGYLLDLHRHGGSWALGMATGQAAESRVHTG